MSSIKNGRWKACSNSCPYFVSWVFFLLISHCWATWQMNASPLALAETTCCNGRRCWNCTFNSWCSEMKYSLCSILHMLFRSYSSIVQHLLMHVLHWESFQQLNYLTLFSFRYVAESSEQTLIWDDLQFSLRKENLFLKVACSKQTSQTARLNE